ncbi:MAG: DUF2141 domain-containing protein [Alphaproteobacteria bacterium]|nr:DUF2141 domain-containing protein [Alphaproteobacteria bacterium]MBL6936665.1 DUF2141 domain-containing protein [Alphaproteobacteria bacterium]MBL7097434.1 DUF2141 domain-containing protein [Alphaproteobacteria bacterium]
MYRILVAGLLAFVIGPACAAPSSTLVIKVENVSPRGGDLRLALYNRQNYPGDQTPVADKVVPAHPGETIVTLDNLKPGTYAVKMFQDFNRNGQFDMNWMGLPIEKYGFSNDARPTFSEPPFEATRFELRLGTNTITIHLQ